MENKKSYIVSFGDSTKYSVGFEGTKEEFLNSDKFAEIKKKVFDYLAKEFPTGGYSHLMEIDVTDDDGKSGSNDLDKVGMEALLDSVKTQVEVMRDGKELNNNAPFDNI